ncbi:MAG: Gx transporter family protein [Lachnospiraceae bacterium]|nr:Gx transporter family protein [Lachnospiraceae bacterium]
MGLKKLTILALYTTLSLIIFAVESAIPPLLPIPGIKPGLANIITLILLRNASVKDTGLVLCARILLSSLLFGQAISLLYSLAGAFLSLAAMALINRLLQNRYIFLTSVTGGITHNLGQLLVAYLITKVSGVLLYLPFLILAGMVAGLFTGLCAHFAQKYLMKLHHGFL